MILYLKLVGLEVHLWTLFGQHLSPAAMEEFHYHHHEDAMNDKLIMIRMIEIEKQNAKDWGVQNIPIPILFAEAH